MDGIKRIDEVTIKRLLSKHFTDGFIIITADKSYIDDKKIADQRFKELKNDIVNAGYSFIPVWGGYAETKANGEKVECFEQGIIVPNQKVGRMEVEFDEDKLKEIGIQLSIKYDQETFLYKPKGLERKAYWIDRNGAIDSTFNDVTVNDLTQQFFTKLHNSKSFLKKHSQFSLVKEIYLNNAPNSLREAYKRYGEQFFRL